MTDFAIRWSGLLLSIGAALLGTAIVMASFAPNMTQQLPPPLTLSFSLHPYYFCYPFQVCMLGKRMRQAGLAS